MNRIFDAPLITTDQSMDRVLSAGLPVLLVFTQGPLLPDMKASLERAAREGAGRLLVVQAEMKDSPHAARRFGVSMGPAVVAYKDGQAVAKGEPVSAGDITLYAAFLLGQGPKPQPRQPSFGYAAPSAAQPGHARPATGGAGGTPPGATARHPQPVTDATFDQEVLRSPLPVLVDFWAPWCGPCRMTNPILEKLSGEMAGRMKIAKVNVDENPQVASRFGVQAIPTMLVVREGKIIDRWAGALPEAMLRSKLASVLR